MIADDTVTTGHTLEKLDQAVYRASLQPDSEQVFLPIVLALCNRSGCESWQDSRIIALVEKPMPTWLEGENPFTLDGQELVPPVERPKENWDVLTRAYD